MNPVLAALLMEYLLIPVIKELASRRGVHGVNEVSLGEFRKNPIQVMNLLKKDPALKSQVVVGIADAADKIGSDAINAVLALFAASTPRGSGNEQPGD